MKSITIFVLAALIGQTASALAGSQLPPCLDANRSQIRDNNNEEVIRWKEETPNQYHDRALVIGSLVGVLVDRKSHLHLEIDLTPESSGRDRSENIEIVYNKSFGEVDELRPGSSVAACGDYITAREQAGPYKPSPVGAIVHWVHASSNPAKHSHGFLSINGRMYGQDERGFRRPSPVFGFTGIGQ